MHSRDESVLHDELSKCGRAINVAQVWPPYDKAVHPINDLLDLVPTPRPACAAMKDTIKHTSMSRMASTSAKPYGKPLKPLVAASDVIVNPDFKHTELLLEARIKTEIQPALKLDADDQICKEFLSPSGCPRGAACPLRHTTPSTANYVKIPVPTTVQGRTVCKHWLRGLCKKGADCEFLHEYNLRKMPECYFFTKHGFCSSGDECMYLHITPRQRRPECRSYTAGFCRAGV